MLSGTLFHHEPAIFTPGLIVFVAFLTLWIADRRQGFMLWWGLGSVLVTVSGMFLPLDFTREAILPAWALLSIFIGGGGAPVCYWAGLAAYNRKPLRIGQVALYALALTVLQFSCSAVAPVHGGLFFDAVNVGVCALIAHRLAALGRWERVGGLLLLARAVNGHALVLLIPGYTMLERVTANQLFGLGVGVALLCAGFLRAVRELDAYRLDLEGAVLARTAQLEAANAELEAFSYSVSHDLRAPLRGLDGFSLALLEDHAERLSATGIAHLEQIRSAARRMAALIDSLLELSRLARRPLDLAETDLTALATGTLVRLQAASPQRRLDARIAPGLRVRGDAALLAQLFDQLLDNAWKFTARSGAVARIEVGNFRHGEELVFFVRDNGVGFEGADAAHAFAVFHRLHADQGYAGAGLGLAMAQRIVQRHGGRIWAESAPGQGASFLFTLPGAT